MTPATPAIDSSPGLKRLPALLSIVAGSADVIGFLGLGGVFVAHITGNLIILAARLVDGVHVGISPILSVPVFIGMLVVTRVFAARLIEHGYATLEPLLALQSVLLAGFLLFGVLSGTHGNPDGLAAVLAAMLGVAGMAVQNALVQIGVRGAPSTAVMTTNITRFTMDLGEVLLGDDPDAAASARRRAAHTWPAILGFAAGAALGAALYAAIGIASLVLPAGGALLALAIVRMWPAIDLAPASSTSQKGST